MTIRIRNDSTSAVVRGYAVDSHHTVIWLEMAPQHPKTIVLLRSGLAPASLRYHQIPPPFKDEPGCEKFSRFVFCFPIRSPPLTSHYICTTQPCHTQFPGCRLVRWRVFRVRLAWRSVLPPRLSSGP
jgi:hypothetical protein